MLAKEDPIVKSHVFVDNVRYWSMLSIVAMHSLVIFGILGIKAPLLGMVLITPFKFGTIGFFLISGFLMGGHLQSYQLKEYLERRIRRIFVPWLCWYSLMALYIFAVDLLYLKHGLVFSVNGHTFLGKVLYTSMFGTALWFVPNLMLGLCVLLLFRNYLDDLRLGAGLLAINLFYTVNIYGEWLPARHSEALFGFVFYLWLGSYAARRYTRLTEWLSRTSMMTLATLAVLAAISAFCEARLLDHRGSVDSTNTLRVTNQIFSIFVVLIFVKIRRVTWPRFVNVRRETFGLYLCHTILLDIVVRSVHVFFRRLPEGGIPASTVGRVLLWLMVFGVTYGLGLAVSRLMANLPATQWLVGATPKAIKSGDGAPTEIVNEGDGAALPLLLS